MSTDDIADRQFTIARKGYEPAEVDGFLRGVTAEVRQLRNRVSELEHNLQESRFELEKANANAPADTFAALGAETTRILVTAEEAATQMRAEAEADASRIRSEAEARAATSDGEAATRLADAKATAVDTVAEADTAAAKTIADAEAERDRLGREGDEHLAAAQQAAAEALQEAEEAAAERIAAAEHQAAQIGRTAQSELAAAERAARERVASADDQAAATLAEAERNRAAVEQEIERLHGVRRDLISQVRAAMGRADGAMGSIDVDPTPAATPEVSEPTPFAPDAVAPSEAPAAAAAAPATALEEAVAASEADDDAPAEPSPLAAAVAVEAELEAEAEAEAVAATDPDATTDDDDEADLPGGGADTLAGVAAEAAVIDEPAPAATIIEPVLDVAPAPAPAEESHAGASRGAVEAALAEAAAVASGTDASASAAAITADLGIDAAMQRERSLAGVRPGMLRRLRRGLQELQNGVLEGVRERDGEGDVDALLPGADAIAGLSDVGRVFLDAGYRAGRADAPVLRGDDALEDPPTDARRVTSSADVLANELIAELRTTLAPSLKAGVEAGEPDASLSERVGEVFRDLKGPVIETVVDRHLTRIYGESALDGWQKDGVTEVRWVLGDESRCPESMCRANASEGPIELGSDFPSGHPVPPVHEGCTCALVPV